MKKLNIPIFIPHLGCPNDCAFCNQKKITGQQNEVTPMEVVSAIESYLPFLNENTEAEIAFFGGSFTGLPLSYQESLLSAAAPYLKNKYISGIRLSTRPDYITEEILLMLKKYGVSVIELGAQSMDDEVLRLANRGHTSRDVVKASRLIQEHGFSLGLQMMTGLLGDTSEKSIETAKKFISLSPSCVRIYPAVVLPDTHLCALYEKGAYSPQSLEEASDLAGELLLLFEKASIPVIRIGLHPSESLSESYVAGPFHPAFGEMAKSEAVYKKIVHFAKEHGDALEIALPGRLLSVLYGQKRTNWDKICAFLKTEPKIVLDDSLTEIQIHKK